MSENVTLALITSLTTTAAVIITGVLNYLSNRKQNAAIVEKVETYHKEVNGKMGKLLETTEALGKAKGKAEEKTNQANG